MHPTTHRTRWLRPLLGIVAGSLAVWALAACGSSSKRSTSTTTGPTTAPPGSASPTGPTAPTGSTAPSGTVPLVQTSWTLVNTSLPGVAAGVTITATFDAGRVGGTSGCNSYSGPYTVSGSKLTIGPDIAGTQMACGAAQMAAERLYLGVLPKTASYRIVGTDLTLVGADGKALLDYTAATDGVAGTWDVTGYRTPTAVTSPIVGHPVTVSFGPGGALTGNSGCNAFRGSYTISGSKIAISGVAATTRQACDADLTKQQADLFAALESASTFKQAGSRITLLQADGTIAADLATP